MNSSTTPKQRIVAELKRMLDDIYGMPGFEAHPHTLEEMGNAADRILALSEKAAIQEERELEIVAVYEARIERLKEALREFVRIDDEDTHGLMAGDGLDVSQAISAARGLLNAK